MKMKVIGYWATTAVSHAVSGDAAWHVIVTGSLAALAVASWALRPQSRTLGVLFPVGRVEGM